jgi:NAD(P)-dependent dehydrogenase (short-subunit alcohol dehydrogenase family)
MPQVVLITGCSSGIGRDLAQRLAQAGYSVVATARQPETLDDLSVALKLPLDVAQPASVNQAVESVLRQFGRIDVLVNNAGYAMYGAVEEISDEQTQQMFDVNVFGALRMVRAVVPHMRKQGAGRIINISSIVGKLAFPVNGVYSATKFALEALSDALRLELAGFGIKVVLIEPGAIGTCFGDTAEAHAQAVLANPASPYRALYQNYRQFTAGMRQQECGPEVVSKVVQQALKAAWPKARYPAAIGFSGKLAMRLGGSVWDLVLRRMFKLGS